jgi:LacI family transcriptional regulator
VIRLKDIAVQAGVSVMTVSKALRDKPDVSAVTKTRIKLLAQQMGYVPDSSAQGLRSRSMKLFGLAVPSCSDPFVARIVQTIEERAYEMGYDIILAQTADIPEREEACLRRFMARRVDGVFLTPAPTKSDRPIYREIASRNIATVVLGSRPAGAVQFASVAVNDTGGAKLAASHLLGLGHKRIAFLAGPAEASWAADRLRGWREALSDAGIDPKDEFVIPTGQTLAEGVQAARRLLQSGCPFTALQGVNDLVAMGAGRVLHEKGYEIPGRISLVGFGDVFFAEEWLLPLTTVGADRQELGTEAMAAMQRLLRGQPQDGHVLNPKLVVRKSTGTAFAAI